MLEYIDEAHLYLYNGVIIPSVSEILHKYLFKDKYKDVPESILKAKAEYGSKVHEAIEYLEKNNEMLEGLNIHQQLSIEQYLKIKEKYNLQVLKQEEMVCYKGIYAGRFDMLANVNGKECLIDIKTTAELDLEYLSWQLSLYELAYGKKLEKLYALWLPKKGLGKLIEIERKSLEEIEKIIEGEKVWNLEKDKKSY